MQCEGGGESTERKSESRAGGGNQPRSGDLSADVPGEDAAKANGERTVRKTERAAGFVCLSIL